VFEFALARHYVERRLNGETLPDVLPPRMRPPPKFNVGARS